MTKLTEKQAAMITRIGNLDVSSYLAVCVKRVATTPGEKTIIRNLEKRGLVEVIVGATGTEIRGVSMTDDGKAAYYELNPEKRPTPPSDPAPPPSDGPEADDDLSIFVATDHASVKIIDGVELLTDNKSGMIVGIVDWADAAALAEAGKLEAEPTLFGPRAGITEYYLPGPQYRGYHLAHEVGQIEPPPSDEAVACPSDAEAPEATIDRATTEDAPEGTGDAQEPASEPNRMVRIGGGDGLIPFHPIDLFDNSYHGPRWRYALRNRPSGPGCQPKGFIYMADRPHPKYRHGTLDYPRELTEKEVYDYELAFIEAVPA